MAWFRSASLAHRVGMRRAFLAIALLIVAMASVGLVGCTRWLAHAIVDAPNQGVGLDNLRQASEEEMTSLGVARQMVIEVGPPDAAISMWLIEPPPHVAAQPRATILVLHGMRDSKRSQIGLGRALAAAGYRAVLIDLRGHGSSTGDWLTYGVVESNDLRQVLDELNAEGLLVRPVGAVGTSYGAAVAIQAAAIDDRIKAIVAIAPFMSLEAVVPDQLRAHGIGWTVSTRQVGKALGLAGQLADFDPQSASPLRAMSQSSAKMLLVHGVNDRHIPCEHSRQLHAAAPDRAQLMLIDDTDHVTIMAHEPLTAAILDWFEAHLGQN